MMTVSIATIHKYIYTQTEYNSFIAYRYSTHFNPHNIKTPFTTFIFSRVYSKGQDITTIIIINSLVLYNIWTTYVINDVSTIMTTRLSVSLAFPLYAYLISSSACVLVIS